MESKSFFFSFQVFIPDDLDCHGRSLAEMSSEELTEYRRRRKSAFRRFATWLEEKAPGWMDYWMTCEKKQFD